MTYLGDWDCWNAEYSRQNLTMKSKAGRLNRALAQDISRSQKSPCRQESNVRVTSSRLQIRTKMAQSKCTSLSHGSLRKIPSALSLKMWRTAKAPGQQFLVEKQPCLAYFVKQFHTLGLFDRGSVSATITNTNMKVKKKFYFEFTNCDNVEFSEGKTVSVVLEPGEQKALKLLGQVNDSWAFVRDGVGFDWNPNFFGNLGMLLYQNHINSNAHAAKQFKYVQTCSNNSHLCRGCLQWPESHTAIHTKSHAALNILDLKIHGHQKDSFGVLRVCHRVAVSACSPMSSLQTCWVYFSVGFRPCPCLLLLLESRWLSWLGFGWGRSQRFQRSGVSPWRKQHPWVFKRTSSRCLGASSYAWGSTGSSTLWPDSTTWCTWAIRANTFW